MFRVAFILFIVLWPNVHGECHQSHMMICDSFDDVLNNTDFLETWTELLLDGKENSLKPVNLMRLPFSKFNKLSTLIVLKQISNIEHSYGYECSYRSKELKLASFYGNVMIRIEEYYFPVFEVDKLMLRNNQIEVIKGGSFDNNKVRVFDVSDNLLEEIESGALPSTDFTEAIYIRNNRLSHIQPKSFPSSLLTLNLEHNSLRLLLNNVLDNLVNLQELVLSRNKFTEIPDINALESLKILDVSNNHIDSVAPDQFNNLKELTFLDLKENLLTKIDLKRLLTPQRKPITLSLGFNRFESIDFQNVTMGKNVLLLYGNPWDCLFWGNNRQFVLSNQFKCDGEIFSSGSVPYCIEYRSLGHVFVSLKSTDVERFRNYAKENAHLLPCHLTPAKNYVLNQLYLGCVA